MLFSGNLPPKTPLFFTPSRIVCSASRVARGNVTLPLESHTNMGDLNRQRCNIINFYNYFFVRERSHRGSEARRRFPELYVFTIFR